MDFKKVVPLIIDEFEKEEIAYSLIGGFALGAFGIMRATMDLDFLVDQKDLARVEAVMRKYNYRCVFKTENVSQYVSDAKIFGEIDFLHAFRTVSLSMLKKAKEISVLDGKLKIRVLQPEDIIALKVQALVNDPGRETKEFADIEAVMDHFKEKLDWQLIKEYFELFKKAELKKKFSQLKEKYRHA